MPHANVQPVIDYSVRGLCAKPYPRHPKGCPNHGRRETCPPAAPLFDVVYDLSRPVIAVWNVFDLEAHVAKMRAKHPGWSQAQLVNCLYWQGTARKQLRYMVSDAMVHARVHGGSGVTGETCPEAMGVNVTATMRLLGVDLEWPPVTKTVQVALLGWRR
jgi:hypothetical protein